jgi:hypothetical protein
MDNAYKMLLGSPKSGDHLRNPGEDGKIENGV